MQIYDNAQIVLDALVNGKTEQVPCLGQLIAVLVPELYLVDRQSDEVKA